MEMLRLHTVVPKNHRVQITLPAEVPVGPAELEVVVRSEAHLPDAGRRSNLLKILDELKASRRQFDGRDIRLSEAVLEERREEN